MTKRTRAHKPAVTRSLIVLLVLASLALANLAACGSSEGEFTDEPTTGLYGKADGIFEDQSFKLTAAFDGSQAFNMWVDSMLFARQLEKDTGKRLRFTYFINTCYFDGLTQGSDIGKARSWEEEVARTALAQQAINEGHEIGDHAVRHKDGGSWSVAQWRKELKEFHAVTDARLFEPVRLIGQDREFAFPDWAPLEDAEEGAFGAACKINDDCDSGLCLALSPAVSICTKKCNKNNPCPTGAACGGAEWNTSKDVCVVLPRFPVEVEGEVLFDATGRAKTDNAMLKPYKIVGFRAPLLAHNAALFEVLTEMGYEYDTSQVLSVGPPMRTKYQGRLFDKIYQFALMKNPGSATIPMDYNYYVNDVSGDRMLKDYKQSILDAYKVRKRQPWNIGHHFSPWKAGAYWKAMRDALTFAAKGCPDDEGELRCPDTTFPTFRELATDLNRLAAENADFPGEDPFLQESAPEPEAVEAPPMDCSECE